MNAGKLIARSGVCLAILVGVALLSMISPANAQTRPTTASASNAIASPLLKAGTFDDEPVGRAGTPSSSTAAGAPISAPTGPISFQRIWLALAIVIAIIFVLQWLSRRFLGGAGFAGSLKAVRILGRAPVSPKQQLVLIQIGRRLVLAANSGTQMNTLCELSDPEEVAALLGQLRQEKTDAPGAFAGLFKRANKDFDAAAEEKQLESESTAPASSPVALQDPAFSSTLSSTQQELSGLMEKVRRMSARQ